MPEAKKWYGTWPKGCDICGIPLDGKGLKPDHKPKFFADCLVPSHGRWGLICDGCFKTYNCSTGTGRGQTYNPQTLEKIEG